MTRRPQTLSYLCGTAEIAARTQTLGSKLRCEMPKGLAPTGGAISIQNQFLGRLGHPRGNHYPGSRLMVDISYPGTRLGHVLCNRRGLSLAYEDPTDDSRKGCHSKRSPRPSTTRGCRGRMVTSRGQRPSCGKRSSLSNRARPLAEALRVRPDLALRSLMAIPSVSTTTLHSPRSPRDRTRREYRPQVYERRD